MTDLQGISLKCEFRFMSFMFVHSFMKSRFQFQFLLWERTLKNKQTKTSLTERTNKGVGFQLFKFATLSKPANFWLRKKVIILSGATTYSLSQPTTNQPQEGEIHQADIYSDKPGICSDCENTEAPMMSIQSLKICHQNWNAH